MGDRRWDEREACRVRFGTDWSITVNGDVQEVRGSSEALRGFIRGGFPIVGLSLLHSFYVFCS